MSDLNDTEGSSGTPEDDEFSFTDQEMQALEAQGMELLTSGMKTFSVNMTPDQKAKLRKLAEASNMSLANYLRTVMFIRTFARELFKIFDLFSKESEELRLIIKSDKDDGRFTFNQWFVECVEIFKHIFGHMQTIRIKAEDYILSLKKGVQIDAFESVFYTGQDMDMLLGEACRSRLESFATHAEMSFEGYVLGLQLAGFEKLIPGFKKAIFTSQAIETDVGLQRAIDSDLTFKIWFYQQIR